MNAETASLFDELDDAEDTRPESLAAIAADIAQDEATPFDDLRDDLDDAEIADGQEPIEFGKKRKKSKTKPVQRTLKYLRKQGCQLVAIVEKWNAYMHGGRGGRQDLFGIIDVLAIRDEQVICVQCCSTDVSAHIDKMTEATFKNPETKTECLVLPALFAANIKVYVHGWAKDSKGKYKLREVELS